MIQPGSYPQRIVMKKRIQLEVPEPCHENWNNMTATEQGKFCLACQKEVIDFSQMSDKEILRHISNASGKSCGRFRNDQLNRSLIPPEEIKRVWWKYWMNVAATFLLMTGKSQAQVKAPLPPTTIQPAKDNQEPYNVTVGIVAYPLYTEYTVAGKITDDSNFPLPGVTVRIKGTPIGTSTDSQGNYSLKVLNREKVDLVVAAVGMETTEVTVVNKNYRLSAVLANVTMHPMVMGLMGDVVVVNKKRKSIAAVFKKKEPKKEIIQPSSTIMGDTAIADIVVGKMRIDRETKFTIKGKIVDEQGEPIGFASIIIANDKSGTAADSTGNFELNGLSAKDFITIKVSAVGYDPKIVKIDAPSATAILNHSGFILQDIGIINLNKARNLDEVIVVSSADRSHRTTGLLYCVTKISTIEKAKIYFNEMAGKKDIRILPNPVSLSGTFTIEFNLKNTGEHAVDIVDASGRQIISRQLMINSTHQLETFSANSFHAAGIYFIRVAEKNGKKVYTAKIVVQ